MEYEYKDLQILNQYKKSNLVRIIFIVSIIMLIFLFSLFVITIGPLEISVFDTYKVIFNKLLPNWVDSPGESIVSVIWLVRVPRVLTAIIVGFSLAVAGAVIQPVLRNSMASPFTLGLSSGAGFGAALAIILGKSIGFGMYYIIANAFFFSLITSAIILIISRLKEITPEMMILIGIAISHLFSAGITMLQYFADSLLVSEVLFWMVGSLSKGTWETLKIMFPIVFIGVILLIIKSKDLNYISVGEDEAKSLGVDVEKTRIILLTISSLVISTTICFTGSIGFVGLISPHITRLIMGNDNNFVVPVSGLIGALLLLLSDFIAMNLITPIVIPIGVMTSFLGVPMFIYLIIRRKRGSF
ncbi:MAG: iron ABC transporter permease [Bacillota bacterium]|nr:iron ABC transporter permease [Bacillota bacterium]